VGPARGGGKKEEWLLPPGMHVYISYGPQQLNGSGKLCPATLRGRLDLSSLKHGENCCRLLGPLP